MSSRFLLQRPGVVAATERLVELQGYVDALNEAIAGFPDDGLKLSIEALPHFQHGKPHVRVTAKFSVRTPTL